jgi:hypothetical protein
MDGKSHLLSLGLIIALVLIGNTSAIAGNGRALVAFDVFELNLDVDTTLNINGDTHFFSSRHNRYIGGRLIGHSAGSPDDALYFGKFFGLMWGKSSFLMNWEEPGIQSFPALDTSISTLAMPFGFDLNWRIGNVLIISPYASVKGMWLHLNVDIGGEDFKGNAFKLGLDAGLKVALNIGKYRFAAGGGLTHIVNDEIEFEVDDLDFDSTTSGASPEYFLGMEF